ncbi:MAG TPA: DUF2231 domain-containing protein [Acidimicrobiales bacterium]|nr:DUF2231 domain-containing protein [Acidimicrobiales bacterium]
MKAANLAGDVRVLADRLRSTADLDRLTQPATEFINTALDSTGSREFLSGRSWLGHPLHPALTDLPIGFWTSALVVDLFGGRKAKGAATMLVASGVAAALPTAMAGAHDFTQLEPDDKRVGIVHAIANTVALLFYSGSLLARLRGRRGRGVYFGVLGAAAATLGGYLGGHLAFGGDNDPAGSAELDVRDGALSSNGRSDLSASV